MKRILISLSLIAVLLFTACENYHVKQEVHYVGDTFIVTTYIRFMYRNRVICSKKEIDSVCYAERNKAIEVKETLIKYNK